MTINPGNNETRTERNGMLNNLKLAREGACREMVTKRWPDARLKEHGKESDGAIGDYWSNNDAVEWSIEMRLLVLLFAAGL
jgi:hypothetical protein